MGNESRRLLLLVIFLLAIQLRVNPVVGICEHSFIDRNKLYNFTLASPLPSFPWRPQRRRVAVNETALVSGFLLKHELLMRILMWLITTQLCGGMIFSHDPPGCAECSDCGDPSRSGMECSALVAKSSGGYHVCTKPLLLDKFQVQMLESLFGDSVCYTTLYMTDELNPFKGVIVRMSSSGKGHNCSLSQSFAIQLELK
ncbi:uncharacterized protein LOC120176643 [Hibiscus syriacus]|uniref:uncharacterized protein LOC120176643 n=1 Tax=Hibiscus syriacus TaxID=106335 RepID=UPI001921C203|nr:uncharacterized protein LOC120176643 [Hibiscus syriacus]